jgi:creatinine amidohydrolase/Fe(II)-dependent formamide hydrolase-like protein
VYFHEAFDLDNPDGPAHLRAVLTTLFARLRRMGFRVTVGVSGHGIDGGHGHPQVTMIANALAPVLRGEHLPVHDRRIESRLPDGGIAGVGVTETGLVHPHAEAGVDHAGYWETCDMLHLCPDSVDLGMLQYSREGIHSPDGEPAEATAEPGATTLDICADAIGRRALQLLESLPADKQKFGNSIDGIRWWMV